MKSRVPNLVNSTDLVQAADRIASRQILPLLVRRLIAATGNQIKSLEMPGDEGVAKHGFDGVVHAEGGGVYVPQGDSVWEMGADKSPRGKAEKDYAPRSGEQSPLSAPERETRTFVFVTPRRWSGKNAWVGEKRRLRHWRDVSVIDADDLHTWLEQAPAVHYWISQELGKVTEGVRSIDSFFEEWSATTSPSITPSLIAKGPRALMEEVQAWIRSSESTKEFAFMSRESGLAMIAAAFALLKDQEKDEVLGRTLVVTSQTAWNELRQQDAPLILIPSFPGLTSEMLHVRSGIRWIRPKGREEESQAKDQYSWEEDGDKFRLALVDLGVQEEESRQLLALARKSLTAFRRRLAIHPSLLRPQWATPSEGRKLLAPLLIGKWVDGRPEDLKAIERMAKSPWRNLADTLIPWAFQDDSPWVCVGSGWYPVDHGDAWSLLAPYLTESDLSDFCEIAVDVLSRPHPKWLAEGSYFVSTPETRRISLSEDLIRGVASTVACMGAEENARPLSFTIFPAWAGRILRGWFENGGQDWRVWAFLSEERILPLLAEAHPQIFLRELDSILKTDDERLKPLFSSRGDGSYAYPPLSGLFAALKVLSMWPEHLEKVTGILLRMSGWSSNVARGSTPLEALVDIYRSWSPITNARVAEQVSILRRNAKDHPQWIAKLLLALLPTTQSMATEPPRAKWRNISARGFVSAEERFDAYREFLGLYLDLCKVEPWRICELIPSVGAPPYWEDRDRRVMEFLDRQDFDNWSPEHREAMRIQIFKLLGRSLRDAQSEPEEWDRLRAIVEQCAPSDLVDKWKWLFVRNPPIRSRDEERHASIVSRRGIALREIWEGESWGGVRRLLSVAENPEIVGVALASLETASERVWDELLVPGFLEDKLLYGLFRGFVETSIHRRGDHAQGWVEDARLRLKGRSHLERGALELLLRYDPERVSCLDPDVRRTYWQGFTIWGLRGVFDLGVIEGLLSVNRCYEAVHALALYREEVPPERRLELSVSTFRRLLESDLSEDEFGYFHHTMATMVDELRKHPGFPEEILLQLDMRYLHSHEWKHLNLSQELGRNPGFFVQAFRAYLPRGFNRSQLSEDEKRAASMGYEILEKWMGTPGWRIDGSIDVELGLSWVHTIEEAFKDDPMWLEVAYSRVGEAMGRYCGESQPSREVCVLIERIGKVELDEGFERGIFNSGGARIGFGGESYRVDAQKFEEMAEALAEFPRVAAIYRSMVAQHRRMAQERDDEHEARQASYAG